MLTTHHIRVHNTHAGLYTIFISQVNKSYTFNPESLLVQDITKIPKLMAYKKPSLIKRWNLKWVHIAPQVHQLSMYFVLLTWWYMLFSPAFLPTIGHVFYQLVLTAYTSSTKV